ncbi:hypothetical protein [Streptomyces sp. 8N706]|uniref:hypothetical protein n=1 Tax=Streptomyces sp. 8N706 TaxID=3457416 RepID=UPI003FD0DC16
MTSMTADTGNTPVFKIGMLGPSRVGKTSLVVSMLTDGERLLGGTPVVLRAADAATRQRLRLRRQELDGGLLARKFDATTMPGTQEAVYFQLGMRAGRAEDGIRFSLLDFPGGWIREPEELTEQEAKNWQECSNFLTECNVLIIPIDATVLMEAERDRQWQSVPAVLETLSVLDIVELWATQRRELTDEPALVVLAPVKCEAYFADNGGFRDDSQLLRERVLRVYDRVIELVRLNASHAQIRYCPVDTLGCVELVRVQWKPDPDEPHVLRPEGTFAVRGEGRISILGAEDILIAVCSLLADARRKVVSETATGHADAAQRAAEEGKELKRGFFRHIRNWANGSINANRLEEQGEWEQAAHLREQAEQLHETVELLAKRSPSGRSRIL